MSRCGTGSVVCATNIGECGLMRWMPGTGALQVPTGRVDALYFFGDLRGVEDRLLSNFVRWIQLN